MVGVEREHLHGGLVQGNERQVVSNVCGTRGVIGHALFALGFGNDAFRSSRGEPVA